VYKTPLGSPPRKLDLFPYPRPFLPAHIVVKFADLSQVPWHLGRLVPPVSLFGAISLLPGQLDPLVLDRLLNPILSAPTALSFFFFTPAFFT